MTLEERAREYLELHTTIRWTTEEDIEQVGDIPVGTVEELNRRPNQYASRLADFTRPYDEALRLVQVAIKKLDAAMDMQEKRETEEFHIGQPTARHIWDEARKQGGEALAAAEKVGGGE